MDINYEVYTIHNAEGTGEDRQYIKIKQLPPTSENKLLENIEHSCTLTSSDVKAAFIALRDHMIEELRTGRRFHISGIGYFSLSVDIDKDTLEPGKKIRGTDLRVRNINFQPERQLLREVGNGTHFVRSRTSSQSVEYTAEALWERISDYLTDNRYITTRIMRSNFGLTNYAAAKWLSYFVSQDLLVQEGTKQSHIYFRK